MRAHAEIRPKPSVSQRTQHKSIERIVVNQNLKFAIARALEDSLENQYVFNSPVPGGHAGRSRARVELVRCMNPYQITPCGPHAREDVGIRPILVSVCFQHKDNEEQLVVQQKMF